jgi:hypothetical protein
LLVRAGIHRDSGIAAGGDHQCGVAHPRPLVRVVSLSASNSWPLGLPRVSLDGCEVVHQVVQGGTGLLYELLGCRVVHSLGGAVELVGASGQGPGLPQQCGDRFR